MEAQSVSSRDAVDADWPCRNALQRAAKNDPLSADGVPYHREESDCEQHGRNKRCECDGDDDAALPTATNIARLSLCHVRPALRERFSVLAPMRTRHIRLGGNHNESQFGLPCLVTPGREKTRNILPYRKIPLRFARALILLQCRTSIRLSQISEV